MEICDLGSPPRGGGGVWVLDELGKIKKRRKAGETRDEKAEGGGRGETKQLGKGKRVFFVGEIF